MIRTADMGNSYLEFTPLLNHSAFVTLYLVKVKLGVRLGISSATRRGFFPDFEAQIPPAAIFSRAVMFPGYTVY